MKNFNFCVLSAACTISILFLRGVILFKIVQSAGDGSDNCIGDLIKDKLIKVSKNSLQL